MQYLIKSFVIFLSLALLLGIYIWRIEPRWLEWNYIDIPIENLPKQLINKKLIQISDIHIGENVEEKYIIKQFAEVNNRMPDIVIYTGDFISAVRTNQAPYDQLDNILKHAVRGKLGTIAILGNHDYGILAKNGYRADSVVNLLTAYGIKVLRNSNINIHGLNIIGIDDSWGTNFYPQEAMDLYNKDLANLVQVHNPDVCDLDVWNGYDGWILSGHTHGGQVRFPFQKASIIPVNNKDYNEGLKHLSNGRTLYINKGIGHSIRIRWNVRPEIAVFTLKKKG